VKLLGILVKKMIGDTMKKKRIILQRLTKNYALIPLFAISLLLFVGLSGCVNGPPKNVQSHLFTFEDSMEGWTNDGTDLSDPPINWSVVRSDELASEGNYSVKLYLNNLNDAGKIWMEKLFNVSSDTQYEVTVSYTFATSDFGDFNLFTLITGVSTTSPETVDDIIFQGNTGHHQNETQDFIWTEKQFTFTVQTDQKGEVYVYIGVWGTWETARTYYVDEVNVSFAKISSDDLPEIEGQWVLRYYDWAGNLTKTEHVTIERNDFNVQFLSDSSILCEGTLLKNNLPMPYNHTDYVLKNCDFGGLGINLIYVYNSSYMKTELPLCENCNPAIFTRM
jgi:hypothetical protein